MFKSKHHILSITHCVVNSIFSPVLVSVGDARFDSSSTHHLQLQPGKSIREPYFEVENSGVGGVENVTAQLGITTYLHCKVNSLGGKTVSTYGIRALFGTKDSNAAGSHYIIVLLLLPRCRCCWSPH